MESEKMRARSWVYQRPSLLTPPCQEGLAGGGRGAPRNGELRRLYLLLSPLCPSLLVRFARRKRDGGSALIRDANFLLTDANMRGHAEDRVYARIPCST